MSPLATVEVAGEDADLRLDRWFKRHYPGLSHARLQKLLRTGQVRIDGKRAKSGDRLEAGQQVRVPPLGEDREAAKADGEAVKAAAVTVSDSDAEALEESILHIDEYVIAINKPPGLAVQGGTGIKRNLDAMLGALRFGNKDRPKLVHRLDKDTSGVLVLGRSTQATAFLAEAFRAKTARKIYWAIVVGIPKPAAGRIDMAISKLTGNKGERMGRDDEKGKKALTYYRIVEAAGRRAAWVSMEPLTGRTHQLRVHMAELGTPILGDGKYGGAEAFLHGPGISRKLHLHARAIRLPHPGGGQFQVVASLPEHMLQSWGFLGFDLTQEDDPFAFSDDMEMPR